jgi:DNA recombination protein RmuC
MVFLFVILGALTAVLALLLRHRPSASVDIAGALGPGLKWVGEGVERVERNLRGDLGTTARSLREEVSMQLQAMQQLVRTGHGELLHVQQDASVKTTTAVLGQLARFGADLQGGTTQTREQLLRMLEQLGQLGADLTTTQREQVAMLQAELLAALHRLGAEQRKDAVDATTRMTTTLQEMTKKVEDATAAQRDQAVLLQQRLVQALSQLQESNEKKLDQMRLVVDEKLQGTSRPGSPSHSSWSETASSRCTVGSARCRRWPTAWAT